MFCLSYLDLLDTGMRFVLVSWFTMLTLAPMGIITIDFLIVITAFGLPTQKQAH